MMQATMTQALPQSTSTKNVQVVRMEPDVKSAKPFELFNAGVSASAQIGKITDPTCYNAVTVELRTGLFENVENKMTHDVSWKRGRNMWTATVGHVKLTITPPYKNSPLPMYHYEFAGPSVQGRGGASSLALCQQSALRNMDEACDREGRKTATNVTELGF